MWHSIVDLWYHWMRGHIPLHILLRVYADGHAYVCMYAHPLLAFLIAGGEHPPFPCIAWQCIYDNACIPYCGWWAPSISLHAYLCIRLRASAWLCAIYYVWLGTINMPSARCIAYAQSSMARGGIEASNNGRKWGNPIGGGGGGGNNGEKPKICPPKWVQIMHLKVKSRYKGAK